MTLRANSAIAAELTGPGEPGVTAEQAASLNRILVHSHSFIHAVMAMESGLHHDRRDPAAAWMPAFAASAERALIALSAALRNPDAAPAPRARRLRIDVETPVPGTGGDGPLETEADAVRTSLRSLDEEIAKRCWL